MNYRIEEKDAFRIVGIKKRVPIIFRGVNPEIASMWKSLNDELINKLKKLSNIEPLGLLSASTNYEQSEGPEILWNESKDVTSPIFRSEIWIPIRKNFSHCR